MKKLDRTDWEVAILIAFIIALPLVEAPKNILWVVFVVTWFINRKATGNWGGKWDSWDTLFTAWIGIFVIGTAFAGISGDEWKGISDPIQYITLFWLIKRSSYSSRQIIQIVIAITAATLLALPTAYWHAFVTHTKTYLELNSVGHSNHSAIYMVISFGILLAFTLAFWKTLKLRYRSLAIAILVIFGISIILSQSRAAAGVMFMLVILFSLVWLPRSKKLAGSLIALLTAAIIAIIIISPPVLEEQKRHALHSDILGGRAPIWNTAILAWREFPLFGIGARNYSHITNKDIQTWAVKQHGEYDAKNYRIAGLSHTHNLYITLLTERGIAGLGIVLLALGAIAWKLQRNRPRQRDENIYWALWGSAFGAWFTHISIGVVNTTLHHEHALLAMIVIGLYLQYSTMQQKLLPPSN